MIKSLQPSVGVIKWLVLAEDLYDLLPSTGSICYAAESKANLFSVDDHRQPHNHQNVIWNIHKSHASLDS